MKKNAFYMLPLTMAIMTLMNGCSLVGHKDQAMKETIEQIREAAGTTGEPGISDRPGINAVTVSNDAVLDLRPMKSSDVMPKVTLKNFSSTNATLEQILMLAFSDSGVSYKLDYEGAPLQSMITSISGFNGTLDQLLQVMSDGMGFFYHYDKSMNLVTISPMQTFAVSLPPVPDAYPSILKIIQKLGANTPIVDESTSQMIFTANRSALKRIDGYLDMMRANLSLLHYEVYIMQVSLERGGELGIRWNDFSLANGKLKGLTSGTAGAASGGAFTTQFVFSNQNFSMDTLLNFLSTQGETQALSQPRIDAISGFPAKLEVVNNEKYVSKIGVAPSVAGSAPVKTVETADLETGLTFSVLGNYRDDTVFTELKLNFSTGAIGQLIDLGDGKVNLPRQQSRKLETKVRVKPGEIAVLSGLIQDDMITNSSGIPFISGTIPTSRAEAFSRKELVIILKPSVTLFNKRNLGEW